MAQLWGLPTRRCRPRGRPAAHAAAGDHWARPVRLTSESSLDLEVLAGDVRRLAEPVDRAHLDAVLAARQTAEAQRAGAGRPGLAVDPTGEGHPDIGRQES